MLLSPVSVKCCCAGQEVEGKIKRWMKPFVCKVAGCTMRYKGKVLGSFIPGKSRRILGNCTGNWQGKKWRCLRGHWQQHRYTNTHARYTSRGTTPRWSPRSCRQPYPRSAASTSCASVSLSAKSFKRCLFLMQHFRYPSVLTRSSPRTDTSPASPTPTKPPASVSALQS